MWIELSMIPEWDGGSDGAIAYFWELHELAQLGGDIPVALGLWAAYRLKAGSLVRMWWTLLDDYHRNYAKQHYKNYVEVLRDGFLGDQWELGAQRQYYLSQFRQEGYLREDPLDFFLRRQLHCRVVFATDGGAKEVHLLMMGSPPVWRSILQSGGADITTYELNKRVIENSDELIDRWERSTQNIERERPDGA